MTSLTKNVFDRKSQYFQNNKVVPKPIVKIFEENPSKKF